MAEIVSSKLIENPVHLCVDMKRTFASGGIWETRRMKRVLPTVIGMTVRYPERAIFTRNDAKLDREASVQWQGERLPPLWRRGATGRNCD
jgi:hypothetical protein